MVRTDSPIPKFKTFRMTLDKLSELYFSAPDRRVKFGISDNPEYTMSVRDLYKRMKELFSNDKDRIADIRMHDFRYDELEVENKC